jgi:hypothetical protein
MAAVESFKRYYGLRDYRVDGCMYGLAPVGDASAARIKKTVDDQH